MSISNEAVADAQQQGRSQKGHHKNNPYQAGSAEAAEWAAEYWKVAGWSKKNRFKSKEGLNDV